MSAQEKWAAAAAEVVGAPVSQAVPLARRREGGVALLVVGAVVFALVVLVFNVLVPEQRFFGYFLGALLMTACIQLGQEQVFAVRTPDGIQMTSSTRWSPSPVGPPLGPLDPATVSGPGGLFRNVFEIGGVKHRTSAAQSRRFRDLVGQGSR
jgi:hypothetical protein